MKNKETKKRPKDYKMKIFTKIVAIILVALMIFAAISTMIFYVVSR